jgi:hypothetical protein
MAETERGKKVVYVHPYKRQDETTVPAHERSTPNTSHGQQPARRPQRQTTWGTSRRSSR